VRPQGGEGLSKLGTQIPPSGEGEFKIVSGLRASRRRRHLLVWGIFLVVAAVVAGGILQWLRPLPNSTVQTTDIRIPGTPPVLNWPSAGEAAVGVDGVGMVGQSHGTKPVPVAGLVEVLAAYVVLKDHPLAPGADGPAIPVNADTIRSYSLGRVSQESEVPVTAGESLTELQALEGLLVDSGADMATLLAEWDATTVSAFVAKMNSTGTQLGLSSTHITDPTGVATGTTSTADDMVRLGEAALKIPVLQQIVSLGQASVPGTTVVYNLNFDLGQDGIEGIKTASDTSAGGCYLFAANQDIDGRTVTVVGAVLGQPAGALGYNTVAVDAGDTLLKSAFAVVHPFTVLSPGQHAGDLHVPWGATVPLTVGNQVSVVGWPGLAVIVVTRPHTIKAPHGSLRTGAVVATLRAESGTNSALGFLRTQAPLPSPGPWWRLTR
jgi:serine-type D-Ala-D-Ala carboxypeptidase (penicillin-binding protein 5/6)